MSRMTVFAHDEIRSFDTTLREYDDHAGLVSGAVTRMHRGNYPHNGSILQGLKLSRAIVVLGVSPSHYRESTGGNAADGS